MWGVSLWDINLSSQNPLNLLDVSLHGRFSSTFFQKGMYATLKSNGWQQSHVCWLYVPLNEPDCLQQSFKKCFSTGTYNCHCQKHWHARWLKKGKEIIFENYSLRWNAKKNHVLLFKITRFPDKWALFWIYAAFTSTNFRLAEI